MTEKLLDLKARLFMQYNLQEHHDYRVQGSGISDLKVSPDSLEMLKDFVGQEWEVVTLGGSDERGNLKVNIMDVVQPTSGTSLNPNELPFSESETPANTEQSAVRQYAALKKEVTRLEAELKDAKTRMGELEPQVSNYFMDNGLQRQTVDGMTVYLAHEIWASAGEDKQAACDALKEAGLGEYVAENFNTNSLSAHIREAYKAFEAEHPGEIVSMEQFIASLHPSMQASLKITETHKVKARKG